jgi:hypothetical protein
MQEWETEEGMKKVADALRGTNGVKIRQGVELGKRIEYFKGRNYLFWFIWVSFSLCLLLFYEGEKLITWLLESENPKRPDIDDRKEATRLARLLLRNQ